MYLSEAEWPSLSELNLSTCGIFHRQERSQRQGMQMSSKGIMDKSLQFQSMYSCYNGEYNEIT